mmetsp:Transcript_8480/g.13175  ORF Transcript_8480/g.13175 Transcript_8480/m.13175 type:complete len:420 (-) Transcript_8480:307-1566(-)
MGTENASSGGKGAPSPRLRRKSAKAAARLVSAVAKEEVTVPEERPAPVKRSYARSQSAPAKSSTRVASASVSSSGSHANKKKTALSQYAVQYLKNWMLSPAHIEHPYPTEDEKVKIMKTTGIEIKQLTNWFVNNRKRYWKPKVEEYKRRSSESNLTVKQIAAKEWTGFDDNSDNNAIVSDEGTDTEKSQPKKKKQRTSSKSGGGGATISPVSTPKAKKNHREAKLKQGKALPSMPALTPGIATAKSHATVKAVNAMRYVGDTSSSDEDLEEDAATIFSSSTIESKVIDTSSNDAAIEETANLAPLPMEWTNGVCGCVADPLSYKISHNGEPCALCAACRDWNAGEFCPWDLTGLIGNMQSEVPGTSDSMDMTDVPAPVERTVSTGEIDLDAKMTASPSTSTFETPQDTSNETWEIADTW